MMFGSVACRSDSPAEKQPQAVAAKRSGTGPAAIVLITIDTMRADALDLSGDDTPFLRQLAGKAVVFANAYSTSSWTAPAVASLMTGLWPHSHGIRRGMVSRLGTQRVQQVVRQPLLSQSFQTLAEKMKAAGFTTIGVAANLHLAARLGFGQGFDRYYGDGFIDAAEVNLRATRFLEEVYGEQWEARWRLEPTFLWLHYFDPHMPYDARRPWIVRQAADFEQRPELYPAGVDAPELLKRRPLSREEAAPLHALYRSEVSYADDQLRKLNERMHFDAEDVLVIVSADHGEEFGEHRGLGHSTTLFDEVVRVPLFVRWPKGLPAARHSQQLVSLTDVYATIAELLGEQVETQGQRLPLARDGEPAQRPLFLQTDRARPSLSAVVDGQWKLIRSQSRRGRKLWLYDLARDPAEISDLTATHPEVAQRLDLALSEHAERLPRPPQDAQPVPVQEGASERLRALGYE